MTPVDRWDMPGRVWTVLLSWGLAVLILAGLFSYWTWKNEHEARIKQDQVTQETRREQDRAMCVMLELLISGPEPVDGPAGERGRAVVAAMRAYRATLQCD
jgi:hypothetical protein